MLFLPQDFFLQQEFFSFCKKKKSCARKKIFAVRKNWFVIEKTLWWHQKAFLSVRPIFLHASTEDPLAGSPPVRLISWCTWNQSQSTEREGKQ